MRPGSRRNLARDHSDTFAMRLQHGERTVRLARELRLGVERVELLGDVVLTVAADELPSGAGPLRPYGRITSKR